MDIHNLVTMANRIGDFFQSMPDRDEAKLGIAQHLKKFWEPRMRVELVNRIDEAETSQLYAIVREAIKENLAALAPQKA